MTKVDDAIKSGFKMNDRLGDLFAEIGSSSQSDGRIAVLYANAQTAIQAALLQDNPEIRVRGILTQLRRDLEREIAAIFVLAITLGANEAARQLAVYEISAFTGSINLSSETQSATDAVLARFDAQFAAIVALLLTEADPEQILGTEERNGAFFASEVIAALIYWATFLVWQAFDAKVERSVRGDVTFLKMAVAVIDNVTTDCCLRVHGQVQPKDKPFHLTGTPRYADYMNYPGFHRYCRTSVALYSPQFDPDGKAVKKMQAQAKNMLAEKLAKRKSKTPA